MSDLQIAVDLTMGRLRRLFGPEHVITIVARNKVDSEADILFTDDDLDEVVASIERLKGEGS